MDHFLLYQYTRVAIFPYSSGWPKRIELGKLETLLMQMTELGKEPEDLEAQADLDYEAEENPVTLTQGSPEQAYTFLAEIYRWSFRPWLADTVPTSIYNIILVNSQR